jgi:hypothetical protein
MKRKILAIGLFCLSGLFAASWFLGYLAAPKLSVLARPPEKQSVTAEPTPYAPTPPSIKGIDAPLLKARWGYEFTPAEANVQPEITKEQALSKAYECRPGTRQATSVVFVLGYLRNPGMLEAAGRGEKVFPKAADPGLIWILVFEGYQSVSSGPAPIPGGPPTVHGRSNEINVVISAITGECIEEIIYR